MSPGRIAHDFTFAGAIRHRLSSISAPNPPRADAREMKQAVNRLVRAEHAAIFEDVAEQENDRDHAAGDILCVTKHAITASVMNWFM